MERKSYCCLIDPSLLLDKDLVELVGGQQGTIDQHEHAVRWSFNIRFGIAPPDLQMQ